MVAMERRSTEVAEYFCEDPKKFKLEELMAEVLRFMQAFTNANQVRGVVFPQGGVV